MSEVYGIIYKATNTVNGKVYIGQTTRSLDKRKMGHFSDAKKNNFYFYNAINKYGKDNFKWEVIAECESKEELNAAEKGAVFINRSFGEDGIHFDEKFGYNMTAGGDGFSMGEAHPMKTEKCKQKIRNFRKYLKENSISFLTEEGRKKLGESSKGKNCIYKEIDGIFVEKHVFPEDLDSYMQDGWTLGRMPKVLKAISEYDRYGSNNSTFGHLWIHKIENSVLKKKRILPEKVEEFKSLGWTVGYGYSCTSQENIQLMKKDRMDGMSLKDISSKYNVNYNNIKSMFRSLRIKGEI